MYQDEELSLGQCLGGVRHNSQNGKMPGAVHGWAGQGQRQAGVGVGLGAGVGKGKTN